MKKGAIFSFEIKKGTFTCIQKGHSSSRKKGKFFYGKSSPGHETTSTSTCCHLVAKLD
jgi:hypothetical protein